MAVRLAHRDGSESVYHAGISAQIDPANPTVLIIHGPMGVIGGAPLDALRSWGLEDEAK